MIQIKIQGYDWLQYLKFIGKNDGEIFLVLFVKYLIWHFLTYELRKLTF